jgi:hypothetical protein
VALRVWAWPRESGTWLAGVGVARQDGRGQAGAGRGLGGGGGGGGGQGPSGVALGVMRGDAGTVVCSRWQLNGGSM